MDRYNDAPTIASKLWAWAEQGGKVMRHGLSCSHYVLWQLDRLGIVHDLIELHFGTHLYCLPPPATVAALPAVS